MSRVTVYRGKDIDDGLPVFAFTYNLPDGQHGLVIFEGAEVLGTELDIDTTADSTLVNRCEGYLNSINFIIDLLNDRHYDLGNPEVQTWLEQSCEIIYVTETPLFGVDEQA